ncbi:MAG: hypothetical protein HOM14_15180 [Gammaproteobacteria bacterium]|jgi:hypothetical protein|nr:hypothetical protein [Gammaproteobacteria bacterium]
MNKNLRLLFIEVNPEPDLMNSIPPFQNLPINNLLTTLYKAASIWP